MTKFILVEYIGFIYLFYLCFTVMVVSKTIGTYKTFTGGALQGSLQNCLRTVYTVVKQGIIAIIPSFKQLLIPWRRNVGNVSRYEHQCRWRQIISQHSKLSFPTINALCINLYTQHTQLTKFHLHCADSSLDYNIDMAGSRL